MNTATLDRPVIEPTTALTLPQRAVVALGADEYELKIKAKVAASADILAVIDPAGREQAHRIGMDLLKLRTGITAAGEAARKDATAFSKAVIGKEKELVALITPEETRVFGLRDAFDEQIAAEKAAKIKVERERIEVIAKAIQAIRDLPLLAVGKSSQEISAMIGGLAGCEPDESFEEFIEQAKVARHEALDKLVAAETAQRGVEIEAESQRQEAARVAAEAEQARIAEAARLEAERAELARLRAENERIANEQAKAAAELKAQQDNLAAQQAAADARDAAALAAQQDAQRRDDDHGPALEMNAMFDAAIVACAKFPEVLAEQAREEAEINADLARCTETAQAMLTNGRSTVMSLEELADSIGDGDPDSEPTDIEIIDVYVENFGGTRAQAVARLRAFLGDEVAAQ